MSVTIYPPELLSVFIQSKKAFLKYGYYMTHSKEGGLSISTNLHCTKMQVVSISLPVNQVSLNFLAIFPNSMTICVDQQIEKAFCVVSVLMVLDLQQTHQNSNVQIFLLDMV